MPPPGANPCSSQRDDLPWIDWVQLRVFQLTCVSAWWFDGLFSPRRHYLEYRETSGTLTVGSNWDQLSGVDPLFRFRARFNLPSTKGRLNAFVGRGNGRDVVAEARSDTYSLPAQFASREDDDVFVGLGFRDNLAKRGSFDGDLGVRVDTPLDPYVKGSYRFARPVGDTNLLRLRETIFWQKSQGFGTTALAELNHVFSEDLLLRWTTSGTYSERSNGLNWYSELTQYHLLSDRRAIAYQGSVNGATDLPVPLIDYGVGVIYRQKIHRDWLIAEVRAGMDWPKYALEAVRHSNLNAGLSVEMRFGDQ